jgi:hypothetical protein
MSARPTPHARLTREAHAGGASLISGVAAP